MAGKRASSRSLNASGCTKRRSSLSSKKRKVSNKDKKSSIPESSSHNYRERVRRIGLPAHSDVGSSRSCQRHSFLTTSHSHTNCSEELVTLVEPEDVVYLRTPRKHNSSISTSTLDFSSKRRRVGGSEVASPALPYHGQHQIYSSRQTSTAEHLVSTSTELILNTKPADRSTSASPSTRKSSLSPPTDSSANLQNRRKTGNCYTKRPRGRGYVRTEPSDFGDGGHPDFHLINSMSEFAIPGTPEFTDLTSSTATAKNTKSTCQAVDADIPQHVASDLVSTLFSHISASTASSSQRSHKIMTRAGGSSRAHKDENIGATAAPFSSEMILRGVSKQPTMGSVFSGDPPANGAASASSWFAFRPLCFTPVDGKASGSTPCPTQSSPLNSSLTFGAEGSVNGTGASGAGMSAGGSGNGGSSSILQFVQSNPAASKFPLLSHRSETSSTGYLRQPPLYFASAYVAAGQANGTAAGANTACFQSHASASTGGHEKRPQRLELFSSSSIPQNRHVQQQQSSNQHCATTSSSFIAGAAASTYSSGARGCVIGLGRSSGSGGAPSVFTAPSSNVNQRIMQLQQSFSDRSAQLILLQEINQALLMGSEDALAGIAVRSLVSCILDLLDAETNDGDESLIELKNLSCNVLSHLMDVLPKAADAVVLAIPLLLNTMSCSFVGDILERIINVLEQVSRRHGRQVLLYGGITAVLGYYDFVTVAQHRTILSMIANCFSDLRKEDFDMVLNCLPSLCERLQDSEPRCVERVCLCFARLIEAYRNDPEKLKSVVSFGLFENLKRLISASPPVVSNVKDIANMLATICSSCPDLAVKLLQLGIAETAYTLLTEREPPASSLDFPTASGRPSTRSQLPSDSLLSTSTPSKSSTSFSLEDRGQENVLTMMNLISELMPPLPAALAVPSVLSAHNHRHSELTSKACDNNNNVQCQKDTVHLDVRAKLFETECRRLEKLLQSGRVPASPKLDDTSADIGETDFGMVRAVHLLLPLLFEVYAELNGIAARLKCLEAIHRMVFYATPLLLSKTVCPRSVSGPIAGMLSSRECTIVVAGLLLASVFIDRLPLEFSPYFRKEGVLFHLSRISEVCAREPVTGASAEPYLHPVPIIPMESSAASSSAKSDKRRHYVGPISVDERAVQVHAGRFASARNATSQNQANNSVSDPPASLGPSLISSVDVRVQRSDAAIEMTQSDIVLSSSRQKTDSGGATVCPQTSLADSPGAVTQPGSSALSFSIPSSMDRMLKGRILNSPSSSVCPGRDSSLRDWILTHCQFLHSRILSVSAPTATTTNSNNPTTLAAKVGRHSPNQSKHSPYLCFSPLTPPTDLFPELESIRQQLLAPNDCLAWATGLRRLAAILTPSGGGGGRGAGMTEQSAQEIPSPFEMQHSGLLHGLMQYLTSSSDRKLRIYLLLMTFVGSRYTEILHLRDLCDNPKTLAALSKLSALCPSEPRVSPFSALVSCLLVYLHQQENFQVLAGPSLSPLMPNAESTLSPHYEEGISRMKSFFAGGGNQNCDFRSIDHEMSGGSASIGGHRNRRTVKSTSTTSASKSTGRPGSNQRYRHPIRRWSSFVPGFLKLDLVYCRSSSSNCLSSSAVDSSSNNKSHSSRSAVSESPESATEALVKGTIWETPPSSIPLHVNALATAQSLKQLLTQRIFLASLVSTCSSGARGSEVTADPSSSIPAAAITPWHPVPFLQKHGTPSRRPLYQQASGNSDQPIDVSDSDCDSHSSTVIGDAEEEEEEEEVTSSIGRLEPSSSFSHAKHHGQVRYVQKHEGSALRKRQITYSLRQSDSEHSHRPPTATVHQDHRAYPVASAEASASVNNRSLRQQNTAPASGQKPCDSGAFVCSNPASATAGDGAGGHSVPEKRHSSALEGKPAKTSAGLRPSSGILRRTGFDASSSSNGSTPDKCVSQASASRPKSMSLLAAFGMLQFASSSSAAASSSSSSPLTSAAASWRYRSLLPASKASASSSRVPTKDDHSSLKLHQATSHSSKCSGGGGKSQHQSQAQQQHSVAHHHHHYRGRGSGSSTHQHMFAPTDLDGRLTPVFYVNGYRIPSNMPLYQAVRRYSDVIQQKASALQTDAFYAMSEQRKEDEINTCMWKYSHTVHYRLEPTSTADSTLQCSPETRTSTSYCPLSCTAPSTAAFSSNRKFGTSKLSPTSLSAAINCLKRPRRIGDPNTGTSTSNTTSPAELVPSPDFPALLPHTGADPASAATLASSPAPISRESLLFSHFSSKLWPCCFSGSAAASLRSSASAMEDECLNTVLVLLRIFNAISELGNTLDDLLQPYPILPPDQFRSHKLSAKASRQLQDVFSVLAGNLPDWLIQLMSMCPFLFPFSIRQTFFYVHNFDRERTILHLQDSTANVGSDSDTSLLSPSTSSSPFGNLVAAPSFSGFSSHQLPLSVSPGSALQLLADVDTGGSSGGSASVISLLTSSLLGSTTAASPILLLGSSSSSEAAVDGDSASGVTLDSLLESAAASSSIVGSGGGGSQLQHHKVTVARDPKRLFRQAEATFNELKASRAVLEIAFDGEVGFGLGPTLEFYTLISHYLMSASLNLWHGNEVTSDGHIIPPPSGLYPRPLAKNARSSLVREVRSKFFFLGQLMARSLLDWRQLDLPFSLTFFKWFLYVCVPEDLNLAANPAGVTAADIAFVDPDFARHYQTLMRMNRRRQNLLEALSQHQPVTAGRTLRTDDVSHSQLHPSQSRVRKELQALDAEIDDLCLSFVLPGYQIELCKNGAQTAVTASNLSDYLVQCANWLLVEGVRRQMLAVIEGFDAVLPGVRTQTLARLFRPHECEGLFCGADNGPPGRQTASGWDVESLMKSCLCDHGYTLQSRTIQFLFEILSEFDERQRRLFVQFTTGSPRLPVGGFRSLKPPLKIVMKKEAEDRADNHLPSVMTCQNYLKLPNYSTKEIMREKLIYAINEGQNAFHLS
uniref:E3 ubiquitin-protein ligase n=1 Tax=Schistocephalus solidus TaxID=70667 RepID=A0A0V0J2B3_SCHSO